MLERCDDTILLLVLNLYADSNVVNFSFPVILCRSFIRFKWSLHLWSGMFAFVQLSVCMWVSVWCSCEWMHIVHMSMCAQLHMMCAYRPPLAATAWTDPLHNCHLIYWDPINSISSCLSSNVTRVTAVATWKKLSSSSFSPSISLLVVYRPFQFAAPMCGSGTTCHLVSHHHCFRECLWACLLLSFAPLLSRPTQLTH